jgi:hypothetical protein
MNGLKFLSTKTKVLSPLTYAKNPLFNSFIRPIVLFLFSMIFINFNISISFAFLKISGTSILLAS